MGVVVEKEGGGTGGLDGGEVALSIWGGSGGGGGHIDVVAVVKVGVDVKIYASYSFYFAICFIPFIILSYQSFPLHNHALLGTPTFIYTSQLLTKVET